MHANLVGVFQHEPAVSPPTVLFYGSLTRVILHDMCNSCNRPNNNKSASHARKRSNVAGSLQPGQRSNIAITHFLPVDCGTSSGEHARIDSIDTMSDLGGGGGDARKEDRLRRLRSEVDETVTILESVQRKAEQRSVRLESLEERAASIDNEATRFKEAAGKQRRR